MKMFGRGGPKELLAPPATPPAYPDSHALSTIAGMPARGPVLENPPKPKRIYDRREQFLIAIGVMKDENLTPPEPPRVVPVDVENFVEGDYTVVGAQVIYKHTEGTGNWALIRQAVVDKLTGTGVDIQGRRQLFTKPQQATLEEVELSTTGPWSGHARVSRGILRKTESHGHGEGHGGDHH